MYYVYILQSQKDSGFYTGLTKNISRRVREHNGGSVRPTKARRPLMLVYSEKCETRAKARMREKFLKTGEGREFRQGILKSRNIPR
ncbi:MAG: GIY-YIG nuclease family protein [Candidatus Campbellbacteria bacterium]|nr:GIY-YIG nuclease family protein [Candidatus Campbellbacteria bacterium]